MTRQILPHRRPNETREIEHDGRRLTVTVGFDLDARPREVFADGVREGTDLAHILADACVVVSLALQHGAEPSALRKSLGVVPDPARGEHATRPASVLGAIVAAGIEAGPRGRPSTPHPADAPPPRPSTSPAAQEPTP